MGNSNSINAGDDLANRMAVGACRLGDLGIWAGDGMSNHSGAFASHFQLVDHNGALESLSRSHRFTDASPRYKSDRHLQADIVKDCLRSSCSFDLPFQLGARGRWPGDGMSGALASHFQLEGHNGALESLSRSHRFTDASLRYELDRDPQADIVKDCLRSSRRGGGNNSISPSKIQSLSENDVRRYVRYAEIGLDVVSLVLRAVTLYRNRNKEEKNWKGKTEDNSLIKTSGSRIAKLSGGTIDFDDIKLGEQIGHGTFGDVYFAELNGTPVAVKILKVQQVSNKRLLRFKKEIYAFCDLNHPNIVRFIGACEEIPKRAIIMEYMQMSLFDALHVDCSIVFSDKERLLIFIQISDGLDYLHKKDIAHCDMKPQNILLRYVPGKTLVVKITDFGLSMMKNEASVSMSQRSDDLATIVGTPRYAAPEILRGERLSDDEMKMADIYSLALIMFQVLYEEEPFYDYTLLQLLKDVGEKGKSPEIPKPDSVDDNLKRLMNMCWDFDPKKRPDAKYVSCCLRDHKKKVEDA